MRTIIFGGRDFYLHKLLFSYCDRIHSETPITEVICGNARGADTLGKWWAESKGIPVAEYPVLSGNWEKEGLSAGFTRNLRMAKHPADYAIGFPTGGPGSENMIKILTSMNIPFAICRLDKI